MAIDLLATLRLKDDFSSGMKKAEGQMRSFGGAASKLTGIVAGLGLGAMAAGFAKDVVQTGIAYTDSMSKVKAVTNASADDIAKLTDITQELGKTSVFSASEAADAASYLGMA